MSHTVQITTAVKNLQVLQQVCRDKGYPEPTAGVHSLFGSNTAQGYAVRLPGWRYPVVFDTEKGIVAYDTYGNKGDVNGLLDNLMVSYADTFINAELQSLGASNITSFVDENGYTVINADLPQTLQQTV